MYALSQYYIIVYIGHSGKRRTRVYDGDIDPYSSTVWGGGFRSRVFSHSFAVTLMVLSLGGASSGGGTVQGKVSAAFQLLMGFLFSSIQVSTYSRFMSFSYEFIWSYQVRRKSNLFLPNSQCTQQGRRGTKARDIGSWKIKACVVPERRIE